MGMAIALICFHRPTSGTVVMPQTLVGQVVDTGEVPSVWRSGHFSLVVEGASPAHIAKAWSRLCDQQLEAPSGDFMLVHAELTTVEANCFNYRAGDPQVIRLTLEQLLQEALEGRPVKARLEY
jgi:hypothetical protein